MSYMKYRCTTQLVKLSFDYSIGRTHRLAFFQLFLKARGTHEKRKRRHTPTKRKKNKNGAISAPKMRTRFFPLTFVAGFMSNPPFLFGSLKKSVGIGFLLLVLPCVDTRSCPLDRTASLSLSSFNAILTLWSLGGLLRLSSLLTPEHAVMRTTHFGVPPHLPPDREIYLLRDYCPTPGL